MKVILFGATGMVGQCALTVCLKSSAIEEILIIGRRSCQNSNDKIKEIIHDDFLDYTNIISQLGGYDACFYCLGVSSLGMSEETYYNITYNYTVATAEVVSKQNSNIHFTFISGADTDETEKSRTFWARIKGKAENVLSDYPFKSVSLFRPAYIKALKGVKPSYSINKYFDWLIYPIVKTIIPKWVITSEELGLAMIHSIYQEEKVKVFESTDIKRLATENSDRLS